jgi:dolichol-phosphate mannosyltransferase
LVSDFSLILPTLNERENIGLQIKEVLRCLPEILQIIVVDDNSTDGTIESVRSEFPHELKTRKIILIERRADFGLTPSLREAIARAEGSLVGWMDCDLSMPPALFREMVGKIESGFDVCIGTRFGAGGRQKDLNEVQQDSKAEIVLSNILNVVLKTTLKLPITDYTSGFVVARKKLLSHIIWRGTHGEYFIDFMFQATRLGAKLTEIPYECGTRKYGNSKTFGSFTSSIRNSYRYGRTVLKVICGQYTGFRTQPVWK